MRIIRESVRFASVRSSVRSRLGPPNEWPHPIWTNACRCSERVGSFYAWTPCIARGSGISVFHVLCHLKNTNRVKSKHKTCNRRDSNPCYVSKLLSSFAVHEQLFYLTRCSVFQCAMWPLCVVKLDIRCKASFEICFGSVVLPVKLLLFECSEERFSNSVVMRPPWIGERLYHSVLM